MRKSVEFKGKSRHMYKVVMTMAANEEYVQRAL